MSGVAPDQIPTSRVSRSAKVGRLAATEAAKQFGTRAANLTRSPEAAEAAMGRRQLETAKQIVSALGTMKGAAMKLGQVMSFLDVGLVPEEFRDEFQQELGKLRDAAPTVSLAEMQKVIERDLGERLRDVFSDFDPEPIAAASIGQVYRATLADDGRGVAVKVQYPGVAAAVRADMQNLGMILRLMKRLAPGLDAQATATEIRERIGEELDYELEAQNQRRMARLYRRHPFIYVPDVVTSLSHEHVLVTEFVSGAGFEELKSDSQAVRDRVAEIVFRFFYGSMYRHHEFSGDPHPGNFMLMADGRMAFLDFGLYKRIDRSVAELELQITRLVIEGDADGLLALLSGRGFIGDVSRYEAQVVLDQLRDASWWYTQDGEVELSPEIATEVLIDASDPRSRYFEQLRHETLPPEHIFGRRLEMLTLAVMAQLRARGNWHRIAREWIYGDPPATELGRQEADFLSSATAS
jgi:predicted unusual protein kinase regulating ubiquinone biosynthesis (AarF/ABC1/UbiB family)